MMLFHLSNVPLVNRSPDLFENNDFLGGSLPPQATACVGQDLGQCVLFW